MKTIQLLNAATAQNGAPSGATAGVAIEGSRIEEALAFLKSTAGSGTMSVKIKLWLYLAVAAEWAPMGPPASSSLTDADRGVLNNGTAIGEVASNKLQHCELVGGLKHADRVYAEVVTIGGTDTAVSLWLSSRD